MFSCEICEISKNTFFHRTPPVAVSEISKKIVARVSKKILKYKINNGDLIRQVSLISVQEKFVINSVTSNLSETELLHCFFSKLQRYYGLFK